MLFYRNRKLAVIEAKAWEEELTEGVGQAKNYAEKMTIRFTYSTNGRGIYGIDMKTGREGEVPRYPTPDELWAVSFSEANAWRDRFATVPFEDRGGTLGERYFRDIAIDRVLNLEREGDDAHRAAQKLILQESADFKQMPLLLRLARTIEEGMNGFMRAVYILRDYILENASR